MRAYAADGHFKAGSMGPKVEACLRFVDAGGESIIASLTEVGPAMAGSAGTHIVPDAAAKRKTAGEERREAEGRRAPAGRGQAEGRRREEDGGPQGPGEEAAQERPARGRRRGDRHQHAPARRERVTAARPPQPRCGQEVPSWKQQSPS